MSRARKSSDPAAPIPGIPPGTCIFCRKATDSFFMCAECQPKSYYKLLGLKPVQAGAA